MNEEFWDTRYAEDGFAYGTEPNAYLALQAKSFTKGTKILVIGDGEGRNGVWLAEQGCEVTSVDSSKVGVDKALALAAKKGVELNAVVADLTEWNWPEAEYDFVVIIYVHFPPAIRAMLHNKVISSLKTGGQLIMESFTPDQLNYSSGGPPVLEMLYTPEMIEEDFKLLKVQELRELITPLSEGKYHSGDGAVVRLLAEKT